MCFQILFLLIVFILLHSIDKKVNALMWPQCGEFIFPKEDTNLTIEEKQFKQNLPTLFESYDCGDVSDVDKTIKSLGKFRNLTSHRECLEQQIISPSLEIVSIVKFRLIFL